MRQLEPGLVKMGSAGKVGLLPLNGVAHLYTVRNL